MRHWSGAQDSMETGEIIQRLFEIEATFLVPTFVIFLALPFPPPHPRTLSHGIWIRWHYFYY